MRKLSIIAMTALLLVFGICLAATATDPPQTLTITVDAPQSADTGKTCAVSVKFSENTGFNTLGVTLNYPEGFTFQSAQVSSLIEESFTLSFAGYSGPVYEFSDDKENRKLTFVGASLEDITDSSGTVFTANFLVDNSLTDGSEYTFTAEYTDNIYSADSDTSFVGTVDASLGNASGIVNATAYPLGDVDFDERVNMIDAMLALRFSSGSITPTEAQKTAADIRADGRITFLDAMAILQIITGNYNG